MNKNLGNTENQTQGSRLRITNAPSVLCNPQIFRTLHRLVNPHDVKKPVFIKYCAKRDLIGSSAVSSYLPPSGSGPTGTRFSSSPTAPRSSSSSTYTSIAPPPVVTVTPPPIYRSSFPTNQRAKRVPGQANDVDLEQLLQQVRAGAKIVFLGVLSSGRHR